MNINHFKQILESEKTRLEAELGKLGSKNPNVEGDWDAKAPVMDILTSDRNEVADKIEEFEENSLRLDELEGEYNEVAAALKRIGEGVYGDCEQGGEKIPLERLEALPTARTCMEHSE